MGIFLIESLIFVASILCVWLIRNFAYRYNWVAKPREDRWHEKPIALYGGVGIFIPFITGFLVLLIQKSSPNNFNILLSVFSGSVCLFLLGFFDDIKDFKPVTKLIGQIISASLPISVGLILNVTPWHLINVILTYFWFIGVINAVNIVDNMDGLSSGVVIISTITIITIIISSDSISYDNISLHIAFIFLYSVAGFWVFNRHPASIFMGDSGSLFLGYILAAIAIPSKLNGFMGTSSSMLAIILPVTIIAIPIFDTILVTILRKFHSRPASLGGKDHSSHRLVGLGFSEKKAVNILYILAIIGGIIAVLLKLWPTYSTPLVVLYVIFLCLVGIYLGRVKTYPEPHSSDQKNNWTPLISQLFYKRQAGEVILDIAIISVSYYAAYLLRFEVPLNEQAANYIQSLPIIVASCMASFFIVGIYRGLWRFISMNDINKYFQGTILGTGVGILSIVVLYRFHGYSKSIFIIFSMLLFLFMVGSRLFFRILDNIITKENVNSKMINVLIYGAGQAGKLILEEIMRNIMYKNYRVAGFADDNSGKHGRTIDGINIFDSKGDFKDVKVDEIWVSSPKIDMAKVDTVLKHFKNDIKVKKLKFSIE